jgi:hypothetical protein
MLEQALAKAVETGKTVFVVGWRDHHCTYMLTQFLDLPAVRKVLSVVNFTRREVTVGTGRVIFRSAEHNRFDFRLQRFDGYDPTTPAFIDHHTWEMYYEQETQRANNAARAARLADRGETPESRYKRREDIKHSPVFSESMVGYTPVADQGTPGSVSCDVSSDASSSSGGSESSGGSCGTD